MGASTAEYHLSTGLRIENLDGLTLHGPSPDDPARLIVDTLENKPAAFFINCSNITLRNVEIVGQNTLRDADGYTRLVGEWEANHGVALVGCDTVTVEDVRVDSVYGDGLYLGSNAVHTGTNTNTTVTRLHVASAGRHGLGLVDCDGVTVDGFTAEKVGTCGIDLEPNGAGQAVLNVEVGNFAIDCRTVALTAVSATYEVSNIDLHDGTITHAFASWPLVLVDRGDGGRQSGWTVQRVVGTYTLTSGYGFSFRNTDGVLVDGCTAPLHPTISNDAGVLFDGCGGSLAVTGNAFGGAQVAVLAIDSGPFVASDNTWGSA